MAVKPPCPDDQTLIDWLRRNRRNRRRRNSRGGNRQPPNCCQPAGRYN